jgi:hypothetical protein
MSTFLQNSSKIKRLIDYRDENISYVGITPVIHNKHRIQQEIKPAYIEKVLSVVTIQNQAENNSKAYTLTLIALILMCLILVISSLIGYQNPYQAMGYICLKCETDICTNTSSPTAKNTTTTNALCSVNCINTTTSTNTTTTTTTSLCYQGAYAIKFGILCYQGFKFPTRLEIISRFLLQKNCFPTNWRR